MTSPRKPQHLDPEAGPGTRPPGDEIPAEPSRANLLTRLKIQAGGYISRHPTLLRILEGLGWNNPGGSMNP